MNKKICIITGANAGIGKQAAVQIAEKGYHVILACRNRDRGQAAMDELKKLNPSGSLELKIVDMGLRTSILKFAEEFKNKYDHLDVLIHNAAIFDIARKNREETAEGIESVWAINHIGPVLLTELLLEPLKKSENGRILTVASKGLLAKPFLKVDLHDPEFKSGQYSIVNAYYQSKLAQIMYTYWLAEHLKGTNITVNSIRVTAVKVDIERHGELSAFMKLVYSFKAKKSLNPEVMAKTYTYLAVSDEVRNITGRYFDENNCEVDSNKYCKDQDNIDAVMRLTQDYIPELGRAGNGKKGN